MNREEEILSLLHEIQEGQKTHYEEWKTELAKTRQEWRDAVSEANQKAKVYRRWGILLVLMLLVLFFFVSVWGRLPFGGCGFQGFGTYSYLEGKEHYEARQWLTDNANPSPLASNRFGEKENAVAFVDLLYQAGAQRVSVVNIMDDPETIQEEGGPYADCLVITLPEDKEKRDKLFEIVAVETQREGFDPDQDHGQKELFLWWD